MQKSNLIRRKAKCENIESHHRHLGDLPLRGGYRGSASLIARAADPPKGAQRLTERSVLKTTADVDASKPGDMIAVACSKCKRITVTYVGPKSGNATESFVKVGEKHLCPGCKTTMEVAGVQKGAHTEIKHVCKSCGDDSAYCCATRRANSQTEGMEK